MNKVILMGRLTRDPESRMTQSSLEISRFSLACNDDRPARDGEREAQFINCVAFGGTANTINRYCHKGSQILVQGRIRNGSYDAQDGTKRYTTDIVVDSFEFCGSRQNSDGGSTPSYNSSVNSYSPNANENTSDTSTTNLTEDPYKDFGDEYTLSSDDLPF